MKISKIVLFLIFFLFILFIFNTFEDYGVSWDEFAYVILGKFYSNHFFDSQAIKNQIELQHAVTHGALFDMLYLLPQQLLHRVDDYTLLHLTKALFSSLTLVFIYLTLRLLSVDSALPLFGVLFMIFTPRWTGDIFDNHIDGSSTLLFSAEIFLAMKLLSLRSKKHLTVLLGIFSIVSAISFSHRTALIIVPLIFSVFFILKSVKKEPYMYIAKLSVFAVLLFLAALLLVDPALRSFGWTGIIKKIIYTVRFQFPRESLFDGMFIASRHLPWYYLPKWIAITTPLGTLFFMILGIFSTQKKYNSFFLLLTFLIPILIVIAVHPVLYDGWRQFLFLSVPMSMFAAVGVTSLFRSKRVFLRGLSVAVFILTLVLTGREMVRLHPYEYVYFNSLVGGLRGAYGKYETDYWGKSYREAVIWLKKNEITDGTKTYRIFVCDYSFSSTYYFSSNMKLVKDRKSADYAVCITRWNEDKKIQGKTIHIVERDGVPLNYVKKLR